MDLVAVLKAQVAAGRLSGPAEIDLSWEKERERDWGERVARGGKMNNPGLGGKESPRRSGVRLGTFSWCVETDFFCSSCADGNTRRQVISALHARINQSNRLLMARQVLASGSPEFQQVQASGCVMSVCECPAHKLIWKAARYSVARSVSCSILSFFWYHVRVVSVHRAPVAARQCQITQETVGL